MKLQPVTIPPRILQKIQDERLGQGVVKDGDIQSPESIPQVPSSPLRLTTETRQEYLDLDRRK